MRFRRRAGGRALERTEVDRRGGWYRLAHALMRRPVPVAVAATALLLVLGLPFLSIRFTGVDASVLPPSASSRVVDTALRNDFAATAASPAYAVLHADAARRTRVRAGRPTAAAGRPRPAAAAAVARRLGAARVVGTAVPRGCLAAARPWDALAPGRRARGRRDRAVPRPEARARSRLALAIGLLCVVTFLLLYRATESLVLPLKTLVMNALTLAATFGILVYVFQDGRLEGCSTTAARARSS